MGLLNKARYSLLTENKQSFFEKPSDLESNAPVTEKKKSLTAA